MPSNIPNLLGNPVNTRDLLLTKTERTTVVVRSQTHFIPVRFELPESLKETMPARQARAIEGQLICRFYCPPMHGDIIEHRGHLWRVTGYHHKPLKKGSRGQDEIPVIHTEHIGVKQG
jgi:hypothetical protein